MPRCGLIDVGNSLVSRFARSQVRGASVEWDVVCRNACESKMYTSTCTRERRETELESVKRLGACDRKRIRRSPPLEVLHHGARSAARAGHTPRPTATAIMISTPSFSRQHLALAFGALAVSCILMRMARTRTASSRSQACVLWLQFSLRVRAHSKPRIHFALFNSTHWTAFAFMWTGRRQLGTQTRHPIGRGWARHRLCVAPHK